MFSSLFPKISNTVGGGGGDYVEFLNKSVISWVHIPIGILPCNGSLEKMSVPPPRPPPWAGRMLCLVCSLWTAPPGFEALVYQSRRKYWDIAYTPHPPPNAGGAII